MWKKGQSGNPKGRPRDGESWATLIKEIGNMDGPKVAKRAGALARQFAKLPKGVTLKELAIINVFAHVINEPTPGLLGILIERAEGTVPSSLHVSGDGGGPIALMAYDYGSAIAALAPGSVEDSESPREGEGDSDGPALGEDANER